VFDEQEDEMNELDDAAAAGENGVLGPFYSTEVAARLMSSSALEIDNLRKEALAFTEVRDAMLSSDDDNATASVVFKKVTHSFMHHQRLYP
jgi:hypothetical protein